MHQQSDKLTDKVSYRVSSLQMKNYEIILYFHCHSKIVNFCLSVCLSNILSFSFMDVVLLVLKLYTWASSIRTTNMARVKPRISIRARSRNFILAAVAGSGPFELFQVTFFWKVTAIISNLFVAFLKNVFILFLT